MLIFNVFGKNFPKIDKTSIFYRISACSFRAKCTRYVTYLPNPIKFNAGVWKVLKNYLKIMQYLQFSYEFFSRIFENSASLGLSPRHPTRPAIPLITPAVFSCLRHCGYHRRRSEVWGNIGNVYNPKLKKCCSKMMLFPKGLFLATIFPKIDTN